jgi:V/A-type H+-transporting ATPase subunit D
MADTLNINPTRGNLLSLKDNLRSMRTRHRLLDRKREILVQELMNRLEKAKDLEAAIIRRYERTLRFITERLEEKEREEIVRSKKIKELQG